MDLKIFLMQGRLRPPFLHRYQVFPRDWVLEADEILDLGFDGLELLQDTDGHCLRNLSEPGSRKRLAKLVSSKKVYTLCGDQLSHYNLMEPESREKFIPLLNLTVELIAECGLTSLVLPLCNKNQVQNGEELRSWFHFFLESGGLKLKERFGVQLLFEIDLGVNELRKVAHEIKQDGFAICLDTGNLIQNGVALDEYLLEFGELVGHIHIKDKDRSGRNVRLGNGSVDFKSFFRELSKVNYRGNATLETAFYKHPREEASLNLAFTRKQVAAP